MFCLELVGVSKLWTGTVCQSLYEYVGNLLYKSDKALEAGVWRIYWYGLPAFDFISGLTTPVPIYPPNTGFLGVIT